MKDVIEVYIKIVIATFGFIAPSFTLLISIFIEGIEKKRIKHEEELKQLEALIQGKIQAAGNLETAMKDNLKQLQNKKKESTKELNLLNPRRQVKRLFIPLLCALFFIGLYHIERSKYFPECNTFVIKLFTLIPSGIFFSYAFYVLWQLFCLIIETKKNLISESKAVILQPSELEEEPQQKINTNAGARQKKK